MSIPLQPLCVADDRTFWPWLPWADFALERTAAADTIVIIPLAGFADWGLGHAYDAEEQVLTSVLRDALQLSPVAPRILMLPPLRFITGHDNGCVCAVDPAVAHAFIDEVIASVAVAGFTRIVLCNASPWNEELVDAAARDIRIARKLQMFCVNLSALQLDFHPARSQSRRRLQTLLTYLSGRAPETIDDSVTIPDATLRDETVRPLAGPAATAAEAAAQGPALLAEAARHLASLLGEIAAHPRLPNGGAIALRTYP
jgi:creatinine amidohydrolase